MRSYLSLAIVALSALEASAFVNPHPASRTTSSLMAEPDGLGEMLQSAKEAFGGSPDAAASAAVDQIDTAGAASAAGDFLSSLPPEALAGAGVLVLAAIAAAASGGSESTGSTSGTAKKAVKKEEPKIDVSIPYDAAARLAFDTWAAGQEDADTSDKAFEVFKTLYESQAVALVTAKRLAREMATFDPSKPVPVPRPEPVLTPPPGAAAPAKAAVADAPFFAVEA